MKTPTIDYAPIRHQADFGFRLEAPSLQRLYVHAALALTDMRAPLRTIQEKEKRTVELEGESHKDLMVRWLNGILNLYKDEKFLCCNIVFTVFDGKKIVATCWGEPQDSIRHGSFSPIKSVNEDKSEMGESSEADFHFYAKIFLQH